MKRTLISTVVLILLLVAVNISWAADYWPQDELRVSTPEEQGIDSETLVKMLTYVRDGDIPLHNSVGYGEVWLFIS